MAARKFGFAALALAFTATVDAPAMAASPKTSEASALLKRANYYRSALSKEQDPALAFHWMREAALKGSPAAQFELGKMLLDARGAPFDLAGAREWLQKAATKDKRAVELLAKISEQPPQPPQPIAKHAPPSAPFALSPAATSRNGAAAMNDAAARGDARALEALLGAEGSIESTGPDGATPLMNAASEGRVEAVRLLLEKGADTNARNARGETALLFAVRQRRAETAALLLSSGKISHEAIDAVMFVAAENCDASTLLRLRELSARAILGKADETPLMHAAAACPAQILESLAQANPIDAADKGGRTALWIAAQHGNSAAVAALLARGAPIDRADRSGVTPLLAALEHGHEDAALLLIRAGANLSTSTPLGQTPLIVSAHRGLKIAALEALNHGAEPNSRDTFGVSALMAAAQQGHAEIVGALLARGADPKLRNKKRETAIELAADEKTRRLLSN